MTLGETVRAWREYRKETWTSLAQTSTVYLEVIALLETADVHDVHKVASLWEVYQISKVLGVTVEQLCEGILPREQPHDPA